MKARRCDINIPKDDRVSFGEDGRYVLWEEHAEEVEILEAHRDRLKKEVESLESRILDLSHRFLEPEGKE